MSAPIVLALWLAANTPGLQAKPTCVQASTPKRKTRIERFWILKKLSRLRSNHLLPIPSKLNSQFQQLLLKFRHSFTLSADRKRLCAFYDPKFSPTSNRISLLSP